MRRPHVLGAAHRNAHRPDSLAPSLRRRDAARAAGVRGRSAARRPARDPDLRPQGSEDERCIADDANRKLAGLALDPLSGAAHRRRRGDRRVVATARPGRVAGGHAWCVRFADPRATTPWRPTTRSSRGRDQYVMFSARSPAVARPSPPDATRPRPTTPTDRWRAGSAASVPRSRITQPVDRRIRAQAGS